MHLHQLAEQLSNFPYNTPFQITANGTVTTETSSTSHLVPVVTASNKYDIEINGGSEKYSQWTALVGFTTQPDYTGAVISSEKKITQLTATRLHRISQNSLEKPVTFLFTLLQEDDAPDPSGKWCILRLKNTEASTLS